MTAGIYLITNKINGHMYVGGSINIEKRLKEHKRGNDADKQIVDKAILKYGVENFTYQIITKLPADWKIIGEHERYWINFYDTFKNKKHYNLSSGGEKDYVMSEKTRQKISDATSGKNNPMYGADRSGKNNPMWKKEHTAETRKKMSENHADFSKEKHPRWKDYARITKAGIRNKKQKYKIMYNGKKFCESVYKERLYEKWYDKYPNIELIDETE